MSEIYEEQIETNLKELLSSGLAYLPPGAVGIYAGELDAMERQEPVPAPRVAFFLGSLDRKDETVTNSGSSCLLGVGVLVIAESYAGQDAARAGEYGAHRISRDVIALVNGSDLGIAGLPELEFLRKRLKASTETRVAYLIEFDTALELVR